MSIYATYATNCQRHHCKNMSGTTHSRLFKFKPYLALFVPLFINSVSPAIRMLCCILAAIATRGLKRPCAYLQDVLHRPVPLYLGNSSSNNNKRVSVHAQPRAHLHDVLHHPVSLHLGDHGSKGQGGARGQDYVCKNKTKTDGVLDHCFVCARACAGTDLFAHGCACRSMLFTSMHDSCVPMPVYVLLSSERQ